MNPILDALTGNVLGESVSELRDSSFSSALDAYETWAAELGVSSTASVSALANVDDGSAAFTLGFNPFKDGVVLKGFHSSEAGIGFYYQQDPGSAANTSGAISATSPNVSLSRFYTGYARMPALLIATRLGVSDNRCENGRWQQADNAAIFYAQYRRYNGTQGTVHTAIKITKEDKITVVCSHVNTANTYLQFMTFNESLTTRTATSEHGGTSFLLSLDTTQEVDLHLATLMLSFNSELNLNPTLNSAFCLQATKYIQLITGSSLSRYVFGWGGDTALFNEPEPIEQIALTFDQLGRPLVFYRVGDDTLKLYWYDPIAQENVQTELTTGRDPTACFDFPTRTGEQFTDAILFYVRDNQIFMRIQRDRYNIEYLCPAEYEGIKINSAGLRVDNRLQVVYEYMGKNPSELVLPPTPTSVCGNYEYFFKGFSSGIETPWRMATPIGNTEFEIGMEITNFTPSRWSTYVYPAFLGWESDGMHTKTLVPGIIHQSHTLFCISPGKPVEGLIPGHGYPELLIQTMETINTPEMTTIPKLTVVYQNYVTPKTVLDLSVPLGLYDINQLRFIFGPPLISDPTQRQLKIVGTFRNIGEAQIPELSNVTICDSFIPVGNISNDLYDRPELNSKLFFGTRITRPENRPPVYPQSLLGFIKNCYVKTDVEEIHWPINNVLSEIQKSVPAGFDATLVNHEGFQWNLIKRYFYKLDGLNNSLETTYRPVGYLNDNLTIKLKVKSFDGLRGKQLEEISNIGMEPLHTLFEVSAGGNATGTAASGTGFCELSIRAYPNNLKKFSTVFYGQQGFIELTDDWYTAVTNAELELEFNFNPHPTNTAYSLLTVTKKVMDGCTQTETVIYNGDMFMGPQNRDRDHTGPNHNTLAPSYLRFGSTLRKASNNGYQPWYQNHFHGELYDVSVTSNNLTLLWHINTRRQVIQPEVTNQGAITILAMQEQNWTYK